MSIAPHPNDASLHPFDWPWLSMINAAVMYMDRQLNIRICNGQAAALFDGSLTVGEVIPLEGCLPSHRDEFHVLMSIAREHRVLKDTVIVWEAGGHVRHVLIDSFPAPGGDVLDDGMVVMMKDLGNFTTLEHQVQRQEKLTTVGKVAAGVAHEIRNPLTTIKGFLQMLANRGDSDSVVVERHHVDVMLEEISRVDDLVSELLLLSRPARVSHSPIDLAKLLQEICAQVAPKAAAKGHEFRLQLGRVPEITGDAQLLRQVFLHLIDNAQEAMESGGQLTIAVSSDATHVQVDVADTGPGIPYYQTDLIFDAFFTTKASGIGLGLPISQRIVQDHDGEIRVFSKGFGTTFRVVLPLPTARKNAPAASASKNHLSV